jgi:short-subunit dehydrogenase
VKVTAICPGATYTPSWEGSGVLPERIMEAQDVAAMLWSAYQLSPQANVEKIVMRPVLGDL